MSSPQKANDTFKRIEKKFWMTEQQYQALLPVLNRHLRRDRYGVSTICNIYYDTPDYKLIRRSIERPLFKEKLRLRSYGIPGEDDRVFIEIKRKLNGIGYKRRISVPFSQAVKLLKGEPMGSDNPQIEKEILLFVERYHPIPLVYLKYQRYAMTDPEDPGLRVTIDTELRYRLQDPERPSEEGMEPIMEEDSMVLMEIKTIGGIPKWLLTEMSRLRIYQAPFSKIGTCYTRHIAGNHQ